MMHAYSELYLSKAQVALGNMLHFAVYDLNEDISSFYRDFLNSGIAERFGKGDPKYTVGHSGVELAYEVIMKTRGEECTVKPEYHTDKTPEYWCGWALAFYQWYKDISFSRIEEIVPIEEVLRMYNPLHEADIKKFVITLDDLMEERNKANRMEDLI